MQILLRRENMHEGEIKCERRNKGFRGNKIHEGENKLWKRKIKDYGEEAQELRRKVKG